MIHPRRQVGRLCMRLLGLGAALLGVAGAAQAQGDGQGVLATFGPAPATEAKAPPRPPSEDLGIALDRGAGLVVLNRLNNDALIDDDAANRRDEKVLRYGVGQDVPWNDAAGVWYRVPEGAGGGWLWVCDFTSPAALGMRLHLSDMNLPAGASVVCYDPGAPQGSLVGPYSGRGLHDSGAMWAGSVFNEMVRVEVRLPGGKGVQDAVQPAALPLRIDAAQHFYRDLAQRRGPLEVGACYNDVTCFPAWANTARAAAGIGFIANNVSLYCSGTLLSSIGADQTPIWLTANHCLSTNADAQSSEIFWLFQSSACNAGAPALASVPRSAVCTLLSTSAASDHTLLMIEGTIPGGLIFAGWNPSLPPDGAALTGIHHPDGSFKRISFGAKQTVGTCSSFGPNHIRVNWAGPSVTEGGSSGSGIFRNDTQQLIGQLHGGPSACGNAPANQFDCYGDFAVTHQAIAPLLAGGSDDALEPNNACAAALNLGGVGQQAFSNLIVKSTSEDWYRFAVPGSGGRVVIDLDFRHAFGDVDAQLLDGCGAVVAASTGSSDSERIDYTNTGPARSFTLRVFLFTDSRNTYSLNTIVAASAPANDTCPNAAPIGVGSVFGVSSAATTDGSDSCNPTSGGDVWYAFTAPASGTLFVNTCGSAYDTVLSVHSGCPGTAANQLACDDDSGNCGAVPRRQSSTSLLVDGGQTYLIRVAGFGGAVGSFQLNLGFTSAPGADACASAPSIAAGSYIDTTVGATTDGAAGCVDGTGADKWYAFTAPATGTMFVDTCGSAFDTVISVHAGCPGNAANQLACDDDGGNCGATPRRQSSTSAAVVGGQTYLIRVAGFSGAAGAYQFNIGFSPVAPSDNCSAAPVITAGLYSGTTVGATGDGLADCGASSGSPDVWYAFPVGPVNGTLLVDLCGSAYDTVVSLHRECDTGAPGYLVACNDDSDACERQSQIDAPVAAGETYLFRVSGYAGSAGAFTMQVSFAPATGADDCGSAPLVVPGTIVGDTTGATQDGAASCTNGATRDVWFVYAAPARGSLVIDTCGSSFDTVVSVHSGCPGNAANQIGCNDDDFTICPGTPNHSLLTAPVEAGGTYRIRLAGFAGSAGAYVMHMAFQPACATDFNGDGLTDPDDLSDVITCFFSAPPCPGADINGDGNIDPDDLSDYITRYFGGC